MTSKALAGMFGNMGKNKKEEFKMRDDDEDDENLL
jgi:hypothetical protein